MVDRGCRDFRTRWHRLSRGLAIGANALGGVDHGPGAPVGARPAALGRLRACPPWAVYIIADVAGGATAANQPVHQFLEIYRTSCRAGPRLTLAVRLVVISQIKINVTNAYSGSLAWTNSFTA